MIEIYTDGARNAVSHQGGWAAVIVEHGKRSVVSGIIKETTSPRMEITAALEGLRRTPPGSIVKVTTDSEYLIGCMTKGWKRRANRELLEELDKAVSERKVEWELLDKDTMNPFHKEAHSLANNLASQSEKLLIIPSRGVEERQQILPELSDTPRRLALPEATPRQIWRIIDANLNRAGEGLRLLEDMARLLLDEPALTQQLKTLRHELLKGDHSFHQQLLQFRNSEHDVGIDIEVPGEEKERELPAVLVANARRVQEALRVLEELAKLPDITDKLDSAQFKQARFNLYTIEQKLLSKLLRQDKREDISGLYVIIDMQALKGRSHVAVTTQVIRGGARIIQLRDKVQNKKTILATAKELKTLCAEHKVLFIVNDYLDVALEVEADGLHLGQEDLPIETARKLVPLGMILGGSVNTVAQAMAVQSAGADYIAVGSIYPTLSKEVVTVVGVERLRQVRQAVSLPLVAIGGITKDNVSEVIAAGADSVTVINAVLGAESPEEASRQIADWFKR